MKFNKKTTYYPFPVYEWNLPAGHACPFAKVCLVKVDRKTGKFDNKSTQYKCYASASERFPAVRKHRWDNFDAMLKDEEIILPKNAKHIRIHASGDFFSQKYFDKWLKVCEENKDVHFWAYTKSLRYWVNRINEIPKNLILTASYGGSEDYLIEKYNLRNVIVYEYIEDVPSDRPIDTQDDIAMYNLGNFALLDNNKNNNKKQLNIFENNV